MNFIVSYLADHFSLELWSLPISDVIIISIFAFFINRKKDWKSFKSYLFLFLEVLALWISVMFLEACFDAIPGKPIIYPVAYLLVFTAYCLIKQKEHFAEYLIYTILYVVSSMYLMQFSKAIIATIYIVFAHSEVPRNAIHISGLIVIFSVHFGLFLMFVFMPLGNFKINPKTVIPYVAIIALIFIIMKIYVENLKGEDRLASDEELSNSIFILFSSITSYILLFLGYFFVYRNEDNKASKKEQLETLMTIQNKNSNLSDIMERNLEEMRSLKHEINNQLSYMEIMMSQKDYGRLEEYFNQFSASISREIEYCDTNNIVIRNVVALEQYKAKQLKISISPIISVQPLINIADMDLIGILLNLLDNAIEAIQVDKINNAKIELNIKQKDNFLFINVINPVSSESNNELRKKLVTLKKDKTLHGRGTKIIQKITESYNGVFDHRIENGEFIADVMLVIPVEGANYEN